MFRTPTFSRQFSNRNISSDGRPHAAVIEILEQRQMYSADPGSLPSTALDLGDLNGTTSFLEAVGTSDPRDVYKFKMPQAGQFVSSFRVIEGSATNITLFRERITSDGRTTLTQVDTRTASTGSSNGDLPARSLSAGTYYLFVSPHGTGDAVYTIGLTSDFAGGSINTSRDIVHATDAKFDDFVGSFPGTVLNDPVDFYKVKMDARGLLTADVAADASISINFEGHLDIIQDFNGNGVVDTGDLLVRSLLRSEAHVNAVLDAGTYFVRVTGENDFSNYHLHVNADYAGDTPQTQRNAGFLDSGKTFNDFIGEGLTPDRLDQYKFSSTATRPFFAAFAENGFGTSALSLYKDVNHDGVAQPTEFIAGSGADTANFILTTIDSGDYILELQAVTGGGTYQLFAEARPDKAGNSLNAARNLGTINGLTIRDDYVSEDDQVDFYKFTALASGRVSAQLLPEVGDADLALIRDANNNGVVDPGEVLAASTIAGSTPDELSKSISAGTYFLRVTYREPVMTSKYVLTFHTDYAGDTPAKARSIGTLSDVRNFDDWASGPFGGVISDTTDLYKFSFNSTKTLTAKLKGEFSGQDLDLELYRDKNNDGVLTANELIASSRKFDSASEQIVKSLSAGTYFVRVAGVNGETNYHLSLDA